MAAYCGPNSTARSRNRLSASHNTCISLAFELRFIFSSCVHERDGVMMTAVLSRYSRQTPQLPPGKNTVA